MRRRFGVGAIARFQRIVKSLLLLAKNLADLFFDCRVGIGSCGLAHGFLLY
jgi:hypothetical protein